MARSKPNSPPPSGRDDGAERDAAAHGTERAPDPLGVMVIAADARRDQVRRASQALPQPCELTAPTPTLRSALGRLKRRSKPEPALIVLENSLDEGGEGLRQIIRNSRADIVVIGTATERARLQDAVRDGADDHAVIDDTRNPTDLERALHSVYHRHGRKATAIRDDRLFNDLFDEGLEALLIVDQDGHILRANKAAAAIFDQDPDTLEQWRFPHPVAGARHMELIIPSKTSGRIFAEMQIVETVWEDRTAYIVCVQDISERIALREQASDRHDESERLNRYKSDLLELISHELKTPLTPVLLDMALLKRTLNPQGLPPAAAEAVSRLDNDLGRFRQMVDSVAEAVRLLRGALRLDKAPIDLAQIIQATARARTQAARAGNIDLIVDAEGPLPMIGDAERLRDALGEILGNALKFTGAGGTVTLNATMDDDAVHITVKDNGIGIERRALDHLFRPFGDIGGHRRKTDTSFGLGLYVARGIINGHAGTLAIDSDGHDAGTAATIRLPLRQDLDVQRIAAPETK